MKNHPEKYGLKNALIIGIVFYPLFVFLDLIIYPEFLFELISIRVAVMVVFFILYFLMYKVADRHLYVLKYLSFFFAAFGITLMCLVTGQGFASTYYPGNILVVVSASIFFRINMKAYIRLLGIIILQHFVLLFTIPHQLQDVLINAFFLGACSLISIFIHYALYNFNQENILLKQFIPICSNCKKIRDDQGFWNQIEKYISENSEVSFSHSICPECMEALYGEDLKKWRSAKKSR